MEAAMAADGDIVGAMVDTAEREKPKPNPKLMLNQKPTPLLKPMLMPMPTMDMVDMVDTDTAVNEEVPMPKLMPTMDMEVVMVDMEDMVDMEAMVDTVEREKPKLKLMLKPMPTTDMVVVMVDMEVTVDMVDTDMDVNQSSLIFIVPKITKNNLFPIYQR